MLVEIGFHNVEAEQAFLEVLPRMQVELSAIPGCLESRHYIRPPRRYLFFTVWSDQEAIQRWVDNEFHRTVLMVNFTRWADEGWFSYWRSLKDHDRSRRCATCGRWSQARPGWSTEEPSHCRRCGAALVPSS
jgi:quinol monooxygenase YgiN